MYEMWSSGTVEMGDCEGERWGDVDDGERDDGW